MNRDFVSSCNIICQTAVGVEVPWSVEKQRWLRCQSRRHFTSSRRGFELNGDLEEEKKKKAKAFPGNSQSVSVTAPLGKTGKNCCIREKLLSLFQCQKEKETSPVHLRTPGGRKPSGSASRAVRMIDGELMISVCKLNCLKMSNYYLIL